MASQKISQLTELTEADGSEYAEVIVPPFTSGTNRKVLTSQLRVTREFNRAFAEEILFDKNEIDYLPEVLSSDVSYSPASVGNLVNQFSTAVQTVTVDGNQAFNFTGFDFVYGITSGQSPEAGTYQIFFMYRNGISTVHFASPSLQGGGAVQLAAPGNFTAVADGENAIDLSWDNVTGNQGYLIEWSEDGVTGWTTLETTAVDAVASTHTGLAANDTRYYRITTLGNGSTTVDSAYATASATTEDAGDVTAPTFTFSPTDGATDIGVSQQIIITCSEAVRDDDGVTEITNANAANYIVLKETNSGGANISFTATIDGTKTIFTITPTSGYGGNQLVFVEIDGVEDVNGNESVADNITFTTSGFTTFNGTSNFLKFGDILDSVWALDNTKFKLRITVRNLPLVGDRFMHSKYSSGENQRSFVWWTSGSSVRFTWARIGASASRVIQWAGVLDANEHDLELQYDGSLDTNDGLDRATLLIDGVTAGSKTLLSSAEVLTGVINNSTAQLTFSAGVSLAGAVTAANYFAGDAKDFQILSGAGDVNELEVPILREGTDVSGNARHGTWV